MTTPEYISTRKAHGLACGIVGSVTMATIRKWSYKYKLGKKIGGRLHIDKNIFMKFLTDGNEWNVPVELHKEHADRT